MLTEPNTLRHGIYRYQNKDPIEAYAQVEDVSGRSAMPLCEAIYRDRGYSPPFDELPWREDYIAAQTTELSD